MQEPYHTDPTQNTGLKSHATQVPPVKHCPDRAKSHIDRNCLLIDHVCTGDLSDLSDLWKGIYLICPMVSMGMGMICSICAMGM